MSVRYGNKVGPLVSRKSSFFKKDRFDNLRIKKPSSNMWIRPTDWLAMPTITSSEQKIAILMPVYPQGSNFLAFTVAEAYTVDWGDGVTENVATGIKAQHEYSYADADLNVTVASGGYKMAIVIITPQAGQNITSVNFNQKYALTGSVFPDTSPILEIVLSCPNLTSITLGNLTATSAFCKSLVSFSGVNMGQIVSFANLFSNLVSLENVSFDVLASILDTNNMFANCRSLKNVPLFNTAAVGDMGTMFSNCSSLTSVPLFNTAAVTNMGSMFSGCRSLTSVPLFNTAAAIFINSTFSGCVSLTSVPLFNTAAVTDMSSTFSGCASLTSVPLFNTAAATNMSSTFISCASLKNVPLFNTAAVTNMSSTFSGCVSLTSVPLFNTAAVTNMGSMFNGCASLTSVPLFNTAAAIFINSMFNGCASLTSVPLFNTAAVTDMSSTFSGCLSLATVPLLISGAGTTTSKFSNMFNSCASLTRAALSGAEYSISFTGCKLSKEELESIFNNLDTIGAPSQTLTISNNWGAPTTVTRTGTTTAGGTTITMANTVDIAVGMQITGTGTPLITARAVTFTDEGDLITLASHGLSNGDEVAFSVITSTTGIIINKIYFVVNAAAETFQIAATSGGAVLPLTTNGSGSLRYRTEVVSINPNVNITISRPTSSAATSSLTFRQLRTGTAILKGWTVTG
jgi:surface protein